MITSLWGIMQYVIKYHVGWVCAGKKADLGMLVCRLVIEATVLIQLAGSLQGATPHFV